MQDLLQGHGLNFWFHTITFMIVLLSASIGFWDLKTNLKKPDDMDDPVKTQKIWKNYFLGVLLGLLALAILWYVWSMAYPFIPDAWK